MDIYDHRYFSINKNLLIFLGLWPYDNRRKYLVRAAQLLLVIILYGPQVISLIVNNSNVELLMINAFFTVVGYMILLKEISFMVAEKKLKIMFDGIAKTWEIIVDEKENEILCKYSEKGRSLVIFAAIYYCTLSAIFACGPLAIVIVNKLNPESKPLPYIYIMNGEFLFENNDSHYFFIFFWELLSIYLIVLVLIATDGSYTVCVYHCMGLFAIVRYRIQRHGQMKDDSSEDSTDSDYEYIVETVKLHQRILKCTTTLEESYSAGFFSMIGLLVFGIPITSNFILMYLDDPVQVIRFIVPFFGLSWIMFTICWCGQQLIDYSTDLFQAAYYNSWYESSARSNKILAVFMLRCSVACTITAGGLVTMNLETFQSLMRTSISYITVLASIR